MPDESTKEVVAEAVAVEGKAPATQDLGVEPTPPAEVLLTQGEVNRLIAEQGNKWERHFQSVAGRQVAEAQRGAKSIQAENAELRRRLTELDPGQADEMELAMYRSRDQSQASEGATDKAREEFSRTYYGPFRETLVELGVNPDDDGVDWGMDAPTWESAHKRLLASATKILKEKAVKREAAHRQALKDHEAKVRKDLGVDVVDNTPLAGGGEGWRKLTPIQKIELGLQEEATKRK